MGDDPPLTPLASLMDKYGHTKQQREMDAVDRMLFELSSIANVTFKASSWPAMRSYVQSWVARLDMDKL
jgi:hypothetical protein